MIDYVPFIIVIPLFYQQATYHTIMFSVIRCKYWRYLKCAKVWILNMVICNCATTHCESVAYFPKSRNLLSDLNRILESMQGWLHTTLRNYRFGCIFSGNFLILNLLYTYDVKNTKYRKLMCLDVWMGEFN